MRRLTLLIATSVAIGALGAATALAFGGSELSASACGGGKLVINVTQKVINDVDSGTGGNNWAFDNLNRRIQVWETGAGTYCASVRYEGDFTTIAGISPGSSGTVAAGLKGTFDGGYRATITGSLLSSPLWSTRGSVGTTDYDCDATGNCPGYVSWLGQFFTAGYGFSQDWWGWEYRYMNQRWINSSDGNDGDITG